MFPSPCTSGTSLNATLWHLTARAIATDARVFNNNGNAGLTYWSPDVNPFRDPRWGRGQEVAGEDPTVIAAYARAFVTGLQQGEDPSPERLKVSACCKHFLAYDLEDWNGTDRHHFNAIISEADAANYYLPAFQACVEDANVSSLMCSYQEINGVPACASSHYMKDIARGLWGFNGYITSDCEAVSDITQTHKWCPTGPPSADCTLAAVTTSGMDTSCDAYLPPNLPKAVADGAVKMSDVLGMLSNLFATRMRLGHFDPPSSQPYMQIGLNRLCANQSLSHESARQSVVLLKNRNRVLPLKASAISSIAVVGPNADNAPVQQGNYFGDPCFSNAWNEPLLYSIRAGMEPFVPTVAYAQGCDVGCTNTTGFAAAAAAAGAADATVVVVGLDQDIESEGTDRVSIALPGSQAALITQVCAASKGPCVVVVMSGGPVDVSAAAGDDNVAAIMYVGYPGPFGGNATAETLFGVVAPAAKVITTVYPANFTQQVSFFDMNLAPGPSAWPPGTNPGRTHMHYTGVPVFPFGWGLSYTTWEYALEGEPLRGGDAAAGAVAAYLAANPRFGALHAPLTGHPVLRFALRVANTGAVDSAEVVLGFLVPPGAGENGVPKQVLFGFERVHVPAGSSAVVEMAAEARHLTRVEGSARVPLRGKWGVVFGVEHGGRAATARAVYEVEL